MTDGAISEMGTYTELIDTGGAFSQFVHKYHNMNEDEETDDGIYFISKSRLYSSVLLVICTNIPVCTVDSTDGYQPKAPCHFTTDSKIEPEFDLSDQVCPTFCEHRH